MFTAFTAQARTHRKHVSLLLSPQPFVHSAPLPSYPLVHVCFITKQKKIPFFWGVFQFVCLEGLQAFF